MITLVEKQMGRPASRPIVAVCDTVQEAAQAVRILRSAGIAANWRSEAPYRVRVDARDRAAALEHLKVAEAFLRIEAAVGAFSMPFVLLSPAGTAATSAIEEVAA